MEIGRDGGFVDKGEFSVPKILEGLDRFNNLGTDLFAGN
jgi:hypothetical protein